MKTIKRIVVGIDFSVYSPEILEYAAGLAERTSAEIVAANIINKRQIDYIKKVIREEHPSNLSLEKFIGDETRRRTVNLDKLIQQWVPKKFPIRTIIGVGVPFEEILAIVDNEQADLLVISSKGRTNFHDYMFGTTAEKIFRHSPVSVLSLNLSQ